MSVTELPLAVAATLVGAPGRVAVACAELTSGAAKLKVAIAKSNDTPCAIRPAKRFIQVPFGELLDGDSDRCAVSASSCIGDRGDTADI